MLTNQARNQTLEKEFLHTSWTGLWCHTFSFSANVHLECNLTFHTTMQQCQNCLCCIHRGERGQWRFPRGKGTFVPLIKDSPQQQQWSHLSSYQQNCWQNLLSGKQALGRRVVYGANQDMAGSWAQSTLLPSLPSPSCNPPILVLPSAALLSAWACSSTHWNSFPLQIFPPVPQ